MARAVRSSALSTIHFWKKRSKGCRVWENQRWETEAPLTSARSSRCRPLALLPLTEWTQKWDTAAAHNSNVSLRNLIVAISFVRSYAISYHAFRRRTSCLMRRCLDHRAGDAKQVAPVSAKRMSATWIRVNRRQVKEDSPDAKSASINQDQQGHVEMNATLH